MIYIEPKSTDAAFHFAAEQYCMEHLSHLGEIMMIWQAENCVMLGQHQIAHAEINLETAARLNVNIVRRSSGGGTIFTDMGTLLYTFIVPCPRHADASEEYDYKEISFTIVSRPMVAALNRLGIPAKLEGRNDILLDGKKVSGLAQRISNHCLCSHGSLLYDADLSTLTQVLLVDRDKIQSKAITSIRSRVTNIIDYMDKPYTTKEFWQLLKGALSAQGEMTEYVLSLDEIAKIEKIRDRKYKNPDWIYGHTPEFNYQNEQRFPMGKVGVFLNIKKGVIQSCKISGDFLGLYELRPLETLIEHCRYDANEVRARLEAIDLTPYLRGITHDEFVACMFA